MNSPMSATIDQRRERAWAWFQELRDHLCARLEALEASGEPPAASGEPPAASGEPPAASGEPPAASGEPPVASGEPPAASGEPPVASGEPPAASGEPPAAPSDPARFTVTPWRRETGADASGDGGGGVMSILRGRTLEKAGVHVSAVSGEFSEEFRRQIPGTADSGRFWAAGISVIVHPRNPHAPTAHMNTRFIVTGTSWFGGGADLTPMLKRDRHPGAPDTCDFHAALKAACDAYDPECHARFRAWCDRYFFLPHRGEARGTGGIFYDRLDSGGWEADFTFVRGMGEAFLRIYPALVERRMAQPWSAEERAEQLVQRGRYAEFNLLHDRGTQFGLRTGGNVEAILSSLPPVAAWT